MMKLILMMINSNDKMDAKIVSPKKKKLLRNPEISLLDLSSKALQAVYNEEHDELSYELAGQARINDNGKSFRYTLTMCFWLAIHLEKTKITPFIYEQDEWLK